VAKLLVGEIWRAGPADILNEQSKVARNTALHLAAANVAATAEFIAELQDLDPTIPNANGYTPFHIAANSDNPNNIMVAMMETFPPNNRYCRIKDGDACKKSPKRLLHICARNGNARAVAMLIRHGAELGDGVLHEIVKESVKNPAKLEGLVAVYGVITDNVVYWWSTDRQMKCPRKETQQYKIQLSQAMNFLMSQTQMYDGRERNVIELCIAIGASDMLIEILNTPAVYRLHDDMDDFNGINCLYDVTNMVRLQNNKVEAGVGSQAIDQSKRIANKATKRNNYSRGDSSKKVEVTSEFHTPKQPYLKLIIEYDEHWRNSSILSTEPFRQLTKPLIEIVQKIWLVFGVIQLIYMICFSVECLPSRCSLSMQYGMNLSDCSEEQPSMQPWKPNTAFGLFLIWPMLVLVFGMVAICHVLRRIVNKKSVSFICCCWVDECFGMQKSSCERHTLNKVIRNAQFRDLFHRFLFAAIDRCPSIAFSVSVFIWYYAYSNPYGTVPWKQYLEITSVVFLFGWVMTFVYFSGITRRIYIFSMALKEILINDILFSFLIVFMFTVVGFSFAMHTLIQTTLPMEDNSSVNATTYEVFLSALSSGSFYEQTNNNDYYADGGRLGFLRVMYALYLTFTAIVLLNLLIAMMSNSYDRARLRAENVWRFSCVELALFLINVPVLRSVQSVIKCYENETIEANGKTLLPVVMAIGNNKKRNEDISRLDGSYSAFRFKSIPTHLAHRPKPIGETPAEKF
jgi:hypothetical protein